ncbi:hypothetical protein ACHAO9_010935 [Fusarium lateritium]
MSRSDNLLRIPQVVFSLILEYLTRHWDSSASAKKLFNLLSRRPEIILLIYHLQLGEVDEKYLRRLLALNFPHLETLTIGDGEGPSDSIDEGQKRYLNRFIVTQPNMTRYSLNTQRRFTLQDIPLFQQPRLTTLILKLANIDIFAHAAVQPLPYDNLRNFRLWASKYPSAALDKFLKNACKLKKFEFHHHAHAPLTESEPPNFSELLQPCQNKLEILQLLWDCHCPLTFNGPGMAFGNFTALRYLAIPPRALFGPYMWTKGIDWLEMVKERIPPNIKILFFQELEIWPVEKDEIEDFVEDYESDFEYDDPLFKFSPSDYAMIKTLLENTALFPKLKWIAWTAAVDITEQWDLCELATKVGVNIMGVGGIHDIPPEDIDRI